MTLGGSYREAIRAGPYRVEIALPPGASVAAVRLLEADRAVQARVADGRLIIDAVMVTVHEVVAVELA